jgi:hypothetical protein
MGFSVDIFLHRLYHAHNWTACIDFDFMRIFRYRWAFEKLPWNYWCVVYIMHFAKTIWGLCSWIYCLSVWMCWLCALFNLLPNVVWNLKSFPCMLVPHLENLLKRMEGLAPGKSLWHLDPSGQTWFTNRFQKCWIFSCSGFRHCCFSV